MTLRILTACVLWSPPFAIRYTQHINQFQVLKMFTLDFFNSLQFLLITTHAVLQTNFICFTDCLTASNNMNNTIRSEVVSYEIHSNETNRKLLRNRNEKKRKNSAVIATIEISNRQANECVVASGTATRTKKKMPFVVVVDIARDCESA